MNYTFLQRISLLSLLTLGMQVLAIPGIQEIRVTQQTGASCGYHATYNAQAVETLALQGDQLTSAAIVREAGQYRNFIQRDAILGDTIIDLANQLGIGNLYCINGRNGLNFAGACRGAQDGNQFLRDVATQQHHVLPLIGHFIVNTGGHWVLFSVVKHPGQQPTVLYMDSVNTPLARNRTALAIGTALLGRLGIAVNIHNPRPERDGARQRKANGRNGRVDQSDYVQEVDYASAYEEDDTAIEETAQDTGFAYKTYLAVGLICLLIGFSSSK